MKLPREEQILNYMRTHGNTATVSELCKELNVSDMTIRRDLQALEQEKKVLRHHGGASLQQPAPSPFNAASYATRLTENQELKIAIGGTAASFLKKISTRSNCNSVFIASGTTLVCLATQMNFPLYNTTLVTDNIHVAEVLGNNPEYTVVTIGGQLQLPSMNAVGHAAENMIRSYRYDYAFISVASIDENGFVYNYNLIEAGTFSAVIESTRHLVVLADSTKFSRRAFLQLFQLQKGHTLITDSGIPEEIYSNLTANGVKVIVAPVI